MHFQSFILGHLCAPLQSPDSYDFVECSVLFGHMLQKQIYYRPHIGNPEPTGWIWPIEPLDHKHGALAWFSSRDFHCGPFSPATAGECQLWAGFSTHPPILKWFILAHRWKSSAITILDQVFICLNLYHLPVSNLLCILHSRLFRPIQFLLNN